MLRKTKIRYEEYACICALGFSHDTDKPRETGSKSGRSWIR